MAIAPITHDLEYETDTKQHKLASVSVSAHYIDLLNHITATEIDQFVLDNDSLITAMGEMFDADPSLVDDGGSTRPWMCYELDLIHDLATSIGIDPDTVDDAPALVAQWLSQAVKSDAIELRRTRQKERLKDALQTLVYQHDLANDPNLFQALFEVLLDMRGSHEAAIAAINATGATDPAAYLRLATFFPKQHP